MPAPTRPTMADVARVAGVSPTTVSHALNDKGRVDPETRAHVRKIAGELGYAPSRAARSLALGRADTIGVLLPSFAAMPVEDLLETDWYGRIAVGASQSALHHRRALALLPGDETPDSLQRFGLEGLIILDPFTDDPRCAAAHRAGLPFVLLGYDARHPDARRVAPDTQGGMRVLLEHLADAGARSVALVATDLDWSAGRDALAAYRRWCGDTGRPERIAVANLIGCRSRDEAATAARHAAHQLLTDADRPDAIIGLFEDFGRGITAAARDLDLAVPEDVMVAQDVDGIKAQLNHPPITALDLHPTSQVAAAVELLLNPHPDHTTVTTPTTLRVRASSTR
ncbi:LacI family DNA-binding transcriptional regulator [Nocardia sp. CDC153]|uniref:LacI family DNA-binding transcriptional regulator n=1 Tax=Nocardia sp. CDC153 TaxID=3112167 RepID=UPI002DBE8EDF|nr:LacI family DNA-binding transcriptional regulator [Nocardia sp. CDC153]MEC3952413.1 LacI family DNA-binding transcriptional regulator [Nocardia sp. CDC153]